MWTRTNLPRFRYAVVPLALAVALLLRWLFWPVLEGRLPFLFAWPAVMISAWYGGLGPGLLATLLAILAEIFFVFEPRWSFHVEKPAEVIGSVLFALLGMLVTALTEGFHQARRAVQEADRGKEVFLAVLSHELRNLLAPVRHAVELLKLKGPTDPALQMPREVIDRQVQHLTRLVDDLLDVNRAARGKLALRPELVEAAAVVARAVDIARPLVEGRKHELTVSLPPEPLWLEVDPARLTQVLGNLLSNAAKYMDDGGPIWLSADREGGDIVFRVRDRGRGIPAEMLGRIFDLFTQVTPSSQGGLGIGLALARSLVELQGGSVAAFSDGPGRGSEFVVRFPAHAVPSAAPQELGGHPGRVVSDGEPRRILVVDDQTDTAETLALLLRAKGHEVCTAPDGATCLEIARRFGPEVVLLDLGLPGMDGLEVARRLRQEHPHGVRVVALTGFGQEEDRRHCREAGFAAHLTKPVTLEELQAAINRADADQANPNGPPS